MSGIYDVVEFEVEEYEASNVEEVEFEYVNQSVGGDNVVVA